MPATTTPSRDGSSRSTGAPDTICASSIALARAAAEEVADPGTVGEHQEVITEGDRIVTHRFACSAKGYRGWTWAVTVSRASRARVATVSEVCLLPGGEAVLSPDWVPWAERIAPGDLGAADALPYREEDPYLEPGFTATGDEEVDQVAEFELGLGRVRVLSREGRSAAAERWYSGDRGPTAEEAVNATAPCSGCGYFLPLAGALRSVFGLCANEWSPSDGRVVSVDHGCGAHSETDVERPPALPLPEPILDETGHEEFTREQLGLTVAADDAPRGESAPQAETSEGETSEGETSEGEVAAQGDPTTSGTVDDLVTAAAGD